MQRRFCLWMFVVIGCGALVAKSAMAQTFVGLGFLPGGATSSAAAVNADGSVVVGYSGSANGLRAFRWTAEEGMVHLGALSGTDESFATDVSGDGTVIVGWSRPVPFVTAQRAFRWTSETGLVELGSVPGFAPAAAYAVSDDGTVVAGIGGYLASGTERAFRWTSAGGFRVMHPLPGDDRTSAFGISGDGQFVVGASSGWCWGAPCLMDGLRWTSSGSSIGVAACSSPLADASTDGSVIIGTISTGSVYRPFRWRLGSGITYIGTLPGATFSRALGVSGDGRAIVGFSGGHGFYWTQSLGMVDLNTWLPTVGVDLSGWVLVEAMKISADGRAIVGRGTHNGAYEAWLAILPPCGVADHDHNGLVQPADVAQFVSTWFASLQAGTLAGDADGNGAVEPADVAYFVNRWMQALASGC